jgi:hypothetical protein
VFLSLFSAIIYRAVKLPESGKKRVSHVLVTIVKDRETSLRRFLIYLEKTYILKPTETVIFLYNQSYVI